MMINYRGAVACAYPNFDDNQEMLIHYIICEFDRVYENQFDHIGCEYDRFGQDGLRLR